MFSKLSLFYTYQTLVQYSQQGFFWVLIDSFLGLIKQTNLTRIVFDLIQKRVQSANETGSIGLVIQLSSSHMRSIKPSTHMVLN